LALVAKGLTHQTPASEAALCKAEEVLGDTRGALNNMQFTGDDFFIDKDVCSIVLEVPNSALGPRRRSTCRVPLFGAAAQ
jgi:hypothetical protein